MNTKAELFIANPDIWRTQFEYIFPQHQQQISNLFLVQVRLSHKKFKKIAVSIPILIMTYCDCAIILLLNEHASFSWIKIIIIEEIGVEAVAIAQ